ncbi:MAG: hypothetical protein D3903_21445 [Candidatus Electrothrix sp. GM3_4]|nr:hypothetical protein [Candidatus Electrothrix sp. GM3_4]
MRKSVNTNYSGTTYHHVGSAHLVDPDGNQIVELHIPDTDKPLSKEGFGCSVAIDGDYILVGACIRKNGGQSGAGSTYLFKRETGAMVKLIDHPNPIVSAHFGYSVALDSNSGLIVIGAPNIGEGKAYLFNLDGEQIGIFDLPDPSSGERFGCSVAIDGYNILIGANSRGAKGAAYLFEYDHENSDNYLTLEPKDIFEDSDFQNNFGSLSDKALFGHSVSLDGNIALIGAPGQNATSDVVVATAGESYAFDIYSGKLTAIYRNPDPVKNDYFGGSVKLLGDAVLIGARNKMFEKVAAGAAYLFSTH